MTDAERHAILAASNAHSRETLLDMAEFDSASRAAADAQDEAWAEMERQRKDAESKR